MLLTPWLRKPHSQFSSTKTATFTSIPGLRPAPHGDSKPTPSSSSYLKVVTTYQSLHLPRTLPCRCHTGGQHSEEHEGGMRKSHMWFLRHWISTDLHCLSRSPGKEKSFPSLVPRGLLNWNTDEWAKAILHAKHAFCYWTASFIHLTQDCLLRPREKSIFPSTCYLRFFQQRCRASDLRPRACKA